MAPDRIQAHVDAEEAKAAARYEGRRRIADVIVDAAKRADAVSRLEAWLRDHPIDPAPPPRVA
jgi:phage baseplate assembly protein W